MNTTRIARIVASFCLCVSFLGAQVPLNPAPSRALGHPQLAVTAGSPNLIEGREFSGPSGIAIDMSSTPRHLYVADAGNNRVLGWRDAAAWGNGATADIVIGQPNFVSSLPLGPGTSIQSGLNRPTAVAVDLRGNLYVADTANNRILRFSSPFAATGGEFLLADLVLGQANLTSRSANQGANAPSNRSLNFNHSNSRNCDGCVRNGLEFDSAGNLWVADSFNNRVLRFPASVLDPGTNNAQADVVLGQSEFNTASGASTPDNLAGLNRPVGLGFDPVGRLFVADAIQRVVVFVPPFATARPAARHMGGINPPPGQSAAAQTLNGASDIAFVGENPYVVDTLNHRLLILPPFSTWGGQTIAGTRAIGQNDMNTGTANGGLAQPSASRLNRPQAAAFADGQLYVVDSGNHRVVAYAAVPSESATRVLGQTGFQYGAPNLAEARGFYLAAGAGIAVDTTGETPHLYVADTNNHRILGFRDIRRARPGDGADLVIGQPDLQTTLINYPMNDQNTPAADRLFSPAGLAVDTQGNLWVADRGNGRVLRFPTPFQQGAQTADLVIGQLNFTSKNTDATSRTMRSPVGLAFSTNGDLLVSDSALHRILFFPQPFSNGMAATRAFGQTSPSDFSGTGSSGAAGRFNSPHHIATDSEGRLYVADTGNNRVQVFERVDGQGNFALQLTQGIENWERLMSPVGMFVNRQTGEIWVSLIGDPGLGGNRSLRFPRFVELVLNPRPQAAIGGNAPIALTSGAFGELLIAEAIHRVALHFPASAPVNAANFLPNKALSPGMIVSLFSQGFEFTAETVSFDQLPDPLPLPIELGGLQVLVNDSPAHLYFVSPGQINFLMPMDAPSSGTVEVQVIRPATQQIMSSVLYTMNVATPGLFTIPAGGMGQVAALNEDNSVNSPANSIARGRVIQLFATGQGVVPGAPPDGTAPAGAVPTADRPQVLVGTRLDTDVLYSGLAPGLVGVWQINVRVPEATAPSERVPVAILYRSILSDNPGAIRTTISVKQ